MKLMVRVLEEAALSRPQQAVLVAMAESANDDGSHCYPSVDKIAWKAGYKPRNVVSIIRELRSLNVLEVVEEATARRPTEYRIHLDEAPRKETFEEWQTANGRHAERAKKDPTNEGLGVQSHDSLSAEIAPVQNDEGCNFTTLGVQSHALGVQSHVLKAELSAEIAPDPVLDPAKDPVHRPSPLARNGPAQTLVAVLYEDVLGIGKPTQYGKAVGQAEALVKAGCTPEELKQIAGWLLSDSFWIRRGVTMSSIASQRDSFRSANNAPISNITHLQARAPNGSRSDAERRREELRQWAYGDAAADPTDDVIDVKGMAR